MSARWGAHGAQARDDAAWLTLTFYLWRARIRARLGARPAPNGYLRTRKLAFDLGLRLDAYRRGPTNTTTPTLAKVLVYPSGGRFKMKVEGTSQAIGVPRLRSLIFDELNSYHDDPLLDAPAAAIVSAIAAGSQQQPSKVSTTLRSSRNP